MSALSAEVKLAGRIAWIGKPTVDGRAIGSLEVRPLPLRVLGLGQLGSGGLDTPRPIGELTKVSFWPDGEVRGEARVLRDKLGDRHHFGCGIDMTPADMDADGMLHGGIIGLTIYLLPIVAEPAWTDCYMEIVA